MTGVQTCALPIWTLDGTLRDLFARWYPALAVNDNEVPIPAAA